MNNRWIDADTNGEHGEFDADVEAILNNRITSRLERYLANRGREDLYELKGWLQGIRDAGHNRHNTEFIDTILHPIAKYEDGRLDDDGLWYALTSIHFQKIRPLEIRPGGLKALDDEDVDD